MSQNPAKPHDSGEEGQCGLTKSFTPCVTVPTLAGVLLPGQLTVSVDSLYSVGGGWGQQGAWLEEPSSFSFCVYLAAWLLGSD